MFEPPARRSMSPESRDALLGAIAKARGWVDHLRLGRIASPADLADREHLGERHVRVLATLAFVSPRIVADIANGTASPGLTVTRLAQGLPHSWAEQEKQMQLRSGRANALADRRKSVGEGIRGREGWLIAEAS